MTTTPEPRWADRTAVAAHLDIHPRTVHRYTTDGLLTAHRLGDLLRYDLNEVDAAMRPGTSEATNLPPTDDPTGELAAGDTHTYVSNACRHGQHRACGGTRPRAKCGYCSAACACPAPGCHDGGA